MQPYNFRRLTEFAELFEFGWCLQKHVALASLLTNLVIFMRVFFGSELIVYVRVFIHSLFRLSIDTFKIEY